MAELVGIAEAAAHLDITRGEMIALAHLDLVRWHESWALPKFDLEELEAHRSELPKLLHEAARIARANQDLDTGG